MEGSFRMITEDEVEFDVEIKPFKLIAINLKGLISTSNSTSSSVIILKEPSIIPIGVFKRPFKNTNRDDGRFF